jgi:solute carrier family 66 (lysosomal lysine-arginine transporter), member 1
MSSPWISFMVSSPSDSRLPAHCAPETEFLHWASVTFHICLPSPLALASTILGTLSIVSWLFAQLPQIYKNHRLRSTSGLSFFFLAIWLLGDLSNLLGCLFTDQAVWQMIVAAYYVTVDCVLVGQWVWFEKLQHGQPLLKVWTPRDGERTSTRDDNGDDDSDRASTIRGIGIFGTPKSMGTPRPQSPDLNGVYHSSPRAMHRMPSPDQSASSSPGGRFSGQTLTNSPTGRPTVQRPTNFSVSASPKTVLFITTLLAVAVRANPIIHAPIPSAHPAFQATSHEFSSPAAAAGAVLSWLSTLSYLGSRLPQLLKNQRRRSTAGLSPTLFIAAFFGNLFYSSSLLTNPCAWESFGPYGGGGWAGPSGSDRAEWVAKAAPFWLGAAGVLALDAAVGVQFLAFGEGSKDEEQVVIVQEHGRKRKGWRWARVHGWMRGWVPTIGVVKSKKRREEERRRLLENGGSGGDYGTA